jgi:hypothetical protein
MTMTDQKPRRFRKKPVVIEAMQFDGSQESASAIETWASSREVLRAFEDSRGWWLEGASSREVLRAFEDSRGWWLEIYTLESQRGPLVGQKDDWIIRGVKGEFYPCKPDIFAATYEPADSDVQPPAEAV